ncbi:MAG: hypothetical protein UR80_C0015G0002 [Parcubacteria group bacterium GW2011_GWB1_35_5]|uniref:DUF559 domain-containing protein n=1 Tax=Candidatus Zambryskibacteria bacterium RIFCSPLOWO2_01_FULL_35_19 TaxID=1802757 RepID=A0A1G2TWP1_9BACT|nr:MAG: hypothetical protein UR80_C0015G0002 [Parcubacteria group bacterium GW2011_GWB1_35_5]OHA86557.1 MAG: hypothetical protein A2726_02015 [Candidatus Zambryskibacteria bacterium RIFCSPHIGHO2_01_FULL_35_32]OHB01711.1 MAG: hypothetical protein A3A90_00240 [Candidatus Zambryskibacteria bacterium RIFCSPLOWO2_01_FULL_35_19]
MTKYYNITKLKNRRRELRKESTPQEILLWERLRNRKLGVKFRRQHSIGGYILDFYCPEKKLIIELDGEIHNRNDAKKNDAVRDKFFEELEYKVLRFKNDEVDKNIDRAVEEIKFQI